MAYTVSREELKIILRNTNLNKYYKRADYIEEDHYAIYWFAKSTDELRFSLISRNGEETCTVHSEPALDEIQEPKGEVIITVNNWQELQEILDIAFKQKERKEKDNVSPK